MTKENTTIVVALDNVALKIEGEVDKASQAWLLAVGEIYNQHLEENREQYAQAYADLMCFGNCTWPKFTVKP
jgi:hypothetical protein